MRIYLRKLFLSIALLISIIIITFAIRLVLQNKLKWEFPKDKTIAFMGASHVYRGIDANQIPCAVNLSKPSERYLFTYIKLKELIKHNPQIKTIILQCGPTDMWQHSDDKYFVDNEMSEFIPLFYPMLDDEMFADYKGHYIDMISFIIQHMFDFRSYVGINYFNHIGYGQQDKALLAGVIDKNDVKPALEKGKFGNAVNRKYLHKIIDCCNEHQLRLILLYFPMYHPEYYYDLEYYYRCIKQLGDVNYLDYSRFPIPDSCRYDAHHLNKDGAFYFTKQLAKDLKFN